VTVEKMLPLRTFAPGEYTLRLKVTDRNANQTLERTGIFTVTPE
jgi:hypothetical protein